jgi:hypothetical protein
MPSKYASIDNKLIPVKDDTALENPPFHNAVPGPWHVSNETESFHDVLCLEFPHSLNLVQ